MKYISELIGTRYPIIQGGMANKIGRASCRERV